MVTFRLLGPVESWGQGPIDIGPPQRRSVLAALAVDAGRAVPIETLMRRVRGADPPDGARQPLYAHVARLRRGLAAAGAVRTPGLLRRSGGYVLDADSEDVDLHRFHRLVADARRAGRSDAEQVTILREALDLWRGQPLAGLSGEWATRVRDTWQRQRLDAVTAWANAETAAGNHAVVIDRVPRRADGHLGQPRLRPPAPGRPPPGRGLLRQRRRAVPRSRDRYFEADALAHLSESHRAAGDARAAQRAARRAADILDELGVPDSDGVRARLRRLGLPAEL